MSDPATPANAGPAPRPVGSPPPGERPGAGRDIPWRLVALGVLVLYIVLFFVLNRTKVEVNFVFFSPRVSLIVALVVAAAVGFVGGWLAQHLRATRRS